ncbi:histidine kinase [Bradyrhizobium sp. SBR1B]|uniref:histidine kinase n=1 Tax=Bradyrhizobium sp. SBR1B TaxID=2663836 RepID=UPI001605EF9D|nr:histidine kinase [Bradyrhizobium sp. SBR1B]MBB4382591.1 Flp pilus assembly protein TadD [Bradyrhizobium sp. SBR1B]
MTGPDKVQHVASAQPAIVSETGAVELISGPERDLLCVLSYAHLACGQSAKSVALLRLVAHEQSQDIGLLRILAYALISERLGDEALSVLDQLVKLDDEPSSCLPLMLMRSHALRHAGRMTEARALFKRYVLLRGSTAVIEQQ